MEEIGYEEGVCKERIRQIEARALRKLKGSLDKGEKEELLYILS